MNPRFIKATEQGCDFSSAVAAPYLRRSFLLEDRANSASLSICGLGFYALWINGTEITKGILAPYISNPDDLCYYDTYDLTPYLKEGENVVGVLLGNGFMNAFGGAVWDFESAVWRGAPRLAIAFQATLENGEELTWEADGEFRTHPSPLLFDEIRMGEHYDARLEIAGWNLPGFDDSDWAAALPAETPRGEMRACYAEPIAVLERRKAISITKTPSGYLYDFGINSAGNCRLRVKGQAGQEIVMRHGECLRDGMLDISNLVFHPERYPFYDTHAYVNRYTLKGGAEEEWTPRFSYQGFRYVQVEGLLPEQATQELLTFEIMSSDVAEIGDFSCSDATANRLYAMVKNAVRSNLFYFPTDCPHREKNGWTGDASMSSDMTVLMYDVEKTYRQWLESIRKSQNEAGALPGIVPTSGWGFHWGNGPTWDSVLFNLPYMLYRYHNNTEVIRENAHAMVRYLDYVLTRRSEDGTVAIGLGDWVPVGKKASAYDSPLALTDSVMVMDMARKAGEMLRAIGRDHAASYAEAISADMRETIRRVLLDRDGCTLAGNCQTSQALGLYYGVFEEHERAGAFARLKEFIAAKEGSFDCGFLGMHTLFHVLSDFGESELAWRMIMKPEYPSYAHLIDIGETAMVEHFVPDGQSCGSHNHHFLGDISRWFMTRVAGLCVLDHQSVRICPSFLSALTEARASVKLPTGEVSVSWKKESDGITVLVRAPKSIALTDCTVGAKVIIERI